MGTMKSTTFAFLTAACAFTAQADTTTTADLKGQVVDINTSQPVSGAIVTFAFNSSVSDTTDEQGNFHLSGQVVGLRSQAPSSRGGMVLERGSIRLDVAAESRVSVEVYGLDSRRVKTLVDRRLGVGAYSVQNPVADLPAGVYTVRARLGRQTAAVKVTSMGLSGVSTFGTAAPVFAPLAKTAAGIIDTVKVIKAGYKKFADGITSYKGDLMLPYTISALLPEGDLKLISEREMNQVDWGKNVFVGVWGDSTQLKGDYKVAPYEGIQSWLIVFSSSQTSSAWGFHIRDGEGMPPEDMSAWKDGHMHIALKGTTKDIGINMESPSTSGNQKILMASAYGFKPDNKWYSLKIPSGDFEIDFSEVKAYLTLSVPDTVFEADKFYQMDDVYWKTTPAPAVVVDTVKVQ